MTYLLVEVGCIECGDDTVVDRIVDVAPDGYRVVSLGESIVLDGRNGRIAIELPEGS